MFDEFEGTPPTPPQNQGGTENPEAGNDPEQNSQASSEAQDGEGAMNPLSEQQQEQDTFAEQEGGASTQEGGEATQEGGVQNVPNQQATQHLEDVYSGWREDRERLAQVEKERTELEERVASFEEKDEELANLSEEDRIKKIVEIREKANEAKKEADRQSAESEVRHYRLTDKFFRDNESRVMKNVIDFNLNSIADGIKMTKGQDTTSQQAQTQARADERRKQNAAGQGGGSAQGRPTQSYDPKVDGEKSISQLYLEGGI